MTQPLRITESEPVKPEAKQPTITLRLDPGFHAYVLDQAKKDRRSPSNWLTVYVQESIGSYLEIGTDSEPEVGK